MSEWYQCPSFAQSSWKGGIQNCTGPDEGTKGEKQELFLTACVLGTK